MQTQHSAFALQTVAGCNNANRCVFRKEATGKIISKGKNNDDCKKPGAEECPTYAKLRDCSACTGSCQKEEALTTDETGVSGCSLALGSFDGGTFVAA